MACCKAASGRRLGMWLLVNLPPLNALVSVCALAPCSCVKMVPPFALLWPQALHPGWQLRSAVVVVNLQLSHSQQPQLQRPLQLEIVPRNGGGWHYAP